MGRRCVFVAGWILAAAAVGACAPATEREASGGAALEARLARLEDIEAIRALLIEYGRTFDARDFAAYAALFAPDGVWEGGAGSYTGPAAIREMVERGFPPSVYPNSYHVMTSIAVDVTGPDSAIAWSRWTFVVNEDGQPQPLRAGRYEDELVRIGGEWKFKRRRVIADMTG